VSQPLFAVAFVLALLAFVWTLAGRMRLLLRARPAGRAHQLRARTRRLALDGLGQRRLLRGEQPAGIMHALIFWGFLVLLLQIITQFGRAVNASWNIPVLGPGQPLGPPFFLLRDLAEAAVSVAAVYMLYRRLIAHTPRLFGLTGAEDRYRTQPHREGALILAMILVIMAGGLVADGGRLVAQNIHGQERTFAPLTALVADLLSGLGRRDARIVGEVGWWLHCLTVLLFLELLPRSKHFHIITALPNVFFAKIAPAGAIPAAALDSPAPAPGRSPGVTAAADLSWKQVLDAFSCTECGRCSAVCPATAAGAPLAPRQLILDLRDNLYGRKSARADSVTALAEPEADAAMAQPDAGVDGAAVLVADAVLWSCTTCAACMEACPVGIEHVPTIVELRRSLVDRGHVEPLMQATLERIAAQGNAYGKSARMRPRWTRSLGFKIPDARKQPVDYLWFVGDVASFDERAQASSRRLAQILHDVGISFGILYDGERNAGNDVRRVGEEGLFELLVEHNLDAFAGAQFKAIFTADPHSLNTLRNEYPAYGLEAPVQHYTELLCSLLADGSLTLRPALHGLRVTYHDPCYLGRYNHVTDAPRTLISATGAELVEMPRHGAGTFCCGAGGGRMWMDDSGLAERPSELRIREAQQLGEIDRFVVSCPKDLAMYSDAATTLGAHFQVTELTALIEEAISAP
jgi:Fe-S oxidoreductase